MIPAGPFASTASPRKKPNRKSATHGVDKLVAGGFVPLASAGLRRKTTAAQTIAMVNIPLNGMSVAAACENPIMPTVVGSSSNIQRRSEEHTSELQSRRDLVCRLLL